MKANVVKMTGLILAMAGALTVASAQGPGGGGKGGQGGRRPKMLSADELIKQFDKNGDQMLSKAELEAMVSKMKSRRQGGGEESGGRGGRLSREDMVKRYDTDGDGKLSEEERQVMFEKMKARRNSSTE